jgi:hypothetical protein
MSPEATAALDRIRAEGLDADADLLAREIADHDGMFDSFARLMKTLFDGTIALSKAAGWKVLGAGGLFSAGAGATSAGLMIGPLHLHTDEPEAPASDLGDAGILDADGEE